MCCKPGQGLPLQALRTQQVGFPAGWLHVRLTSSAWTCLNCNSFIMTNTGRGGEMRAAHGRRGWPELVGKTYAEAEAAIKEVAPDIKKVVRVPMGSMVTQDYREVRVRALAGQHSTAGAC